MNKYYVLYALLLISYAAGAQWNDQNTNTSDNLNDVFFLNDNTGWAVGRNGTVVHTTDGGTTWTAQNSGTQADLNEVFVISSSVGYAVGDDGAVIKYDGTSWSELSNVGTTLDMFGVYFLSAEQGWICGDWGRIMRTDDGGDSWTTENDNGDFSNQLNDIHMFSESDGWVVGTTGKIAHYNGNFWGDVDGGTTTEFLGMDFLDEDNGIAVGKSGTIRVYDGSSWSTSNSGLSSTFIHDVSWASADLAYAACSDGLILRYDGNVWTKDYEYTDIGTEIFYGIEARSSGSVWASGVSGLMKNKVGDASGLTEHKDQSDLVSIYPNPSGKRFLIASKRDLQSLSITDMQGRNICTKQLPYGMTEIELSGFERGLYFITVQTESGQEVHAHVIE